MTKESSPDSQQGAVSFTLFCLRSYFRKALTLESSNPNSTTKSSRKAHPPKCATSAWRKDVSQNFASMNKFVGHVMEGGIRKEIPFLPWVYHPIRAPLLTPSSNSKAPLPWPLRSPRLAPLCPPRRMSGPFQAARCPSAALLLTGVLPGAPLPLIRPAVRRCTPQWHLTGLMRTIIRRGPSPLQAPVMYRAMDTKEKNQKWAPMQKTRTLLIPGQGNLSKVYTGSSLVCRFGSVPGLP